MGESVPIEQLEHRCRTARPHLEGLRFREIRRGLRDRLDAGPVGLAPAVGVALANEGERQTKSKQESPKKRPEILHMR